MTEHAQAAIGLTIQDHLKPEMLAFDIGANKGHVAEVMSAICRQVVAFEPNPALAEELRGSMPENVTVEQFAMSDVEGTATFYIDERPGLQGLASSLMKLDGMETVTMPVEVQTRTLDSYCAEKGLYPDFIKIDVEGFEPQVFSGGMQTIRTARPILLFEFWETHYERFRPWFEELSKTHELHRVSDGAEAVSWYAQNASQSIVDILCLPRAQTTD